MTRAIVALGCVLVACGASTEPPVDGSSGSDATAADSAVVDAPSADMGIDCASAREGEP